MDGELKNQVILITGAAGGIGKELCHQLAEKNADLVMSDIKKSKLEILKKDLESKGSKVLNIDMDIRNEKSIEKNVKKAFDKFGKINAVVQNACIFNAYNFDDIPKKDKIDIYMSNIYGTCKLSEEIFKYWEKQKDENKKMIYVASIAGLEKNPDKRQVYAFTKRMMIEMFHKNLSRFYDKGVEFCCICPPPTNTPMWKKVCEEIAKREGIKPEDVVQKYLAAGTTRVFEPSEIAEDIVNLIEEENNNGILYIPDKDKRILYKNKNLDNFKELDKTIEDIKSNKI